MKKKRTMMYSLVCFLFLFVFVSGNIYGQNGKVNLNYKDASFVEVINDFHEQTGVKFMYNLEKVKDKKCKDLIMKDMPVKDAIRVVLKYFGLTYSMIEGVVVVKELGENLQTGKTVTGTVCDENGELLPGVTVLVKGTTLGVATDVNGNFKVTFPGETENTLIFSFVGMRTKMVKCTDDKPLKITMQMDAAQLEEVVVFDDGYNRLPRKDMVGAYTTVKAEDIMMPAYQSVDQMLQGKIAGLQVINTSSRVGATPQIKIRGTSTLLGNKSPLWVVDGVIQEEPLSIDVSSQLTGNMADLIGNEISWLNPLDIENVTVLKDASATAIYGSRASNGVIVITTKRGAKERASVRYSTHFSVRQRSHYGLYDFMNSKERIQFSKEAYDAGARYQQEPLPQKYTYEGLMAMFNDRQITEQEFMVQMEKLETVNTDWFDLLTRNSISQNHNLSVSGGSQKVTYNASVGYSKNAGIEIGNENDQFTSRLNVFAELNKRLSISLNLNGSIRNSDGYGPGVNPYSYALNTSRAVPAYEEDGSLAYYKNYYTYQLNPVLGGYNTYSYNIFNEMENSYSKNKGVNFNVSATLDFKILDWLSWQATGSLTQSMNDSEGYAGEKTSTVECLYRGYPYNSEKSGSEKFNAALLPWGGTLTTSNSEGLSLNMSHRLAFSKTFNEDHRINAMLGMELRSSKQRSNGNTVWGYVPERGEIIVRRYPL